MIEEEFCSGITQNPDLVKALKTFPIVKIAKAYNEGMLNDFLEEAPPEEAFDFLTGTLLIYLKNGDIIAFGRESLKYSVVTWFDTLNGEQTTTKYYDQEWSDYITNEDPVYSKKNNWNHIIGEKIKSVKVLIIDQGEKKYFDDSLQRAVILETEKGDMVFSYCLLDLPSGSPTPLTRKEDIPQEIWDKAEIIEL